MAVMFLGSVMRIATSTRFVLPTIQSTRCQMYTSGTFGCGCTSPKSAKTLIRYRIATRELRFLMSCQLSSKSLKAFSRL